MHMNTIKKDIINRTDLTWSKTRRSSGTAGSFLKAEEVINGRKIYYKLSNYEQGKGVVGHECINEIIVDRLLNIWGIEHLRYDLIHMKINVFGDEIITWVCASEDFKQAGESKIAMELWYEMEANTDETHMEFVQRKGCADYIYNMLAVDYLILNRDRHGANIELLKNRVTKTYRPAPLFDHGLSMILENDPDKIRAFDITKTKQVQCFVGRTDPEFNVRLIPRDRMPELRPFTEEDREYIFADMDTCISPELREKIWELLNYRRNMYESIRNQK